MGHGENVPSDYYCSAMYATCALCGRRYHLADGECSCSAGLESCACGNRDWERRDGEVVCCACGTRPGEEVDDDED